MARCKPRSKSAKCRNVRTAVNSAPIRRRRSVSSLYRITQNNLTRIAEDGQIRQGEAT